MCNLKGSPQTTQNQSSNNFTQGQNSGTGTSDSTSNSNQIGFNSSTVGPNPETLALYQQLLGNAGNLANTPWNPYTGQQVAPFTQAQQDAGNSLWSTGLKGMGFVPEASSLIGQAGQSTTGQLPGLANQLTSPYAAQAANFGMGTGSNLAGYGVGQGANIGNYGTGLAARGPQLQQFSSGAVNQYMSPYTQAVVNATQNQFNNQNAVQSSALLGEGIKAGNAFGGDREGIAQAQLAGQQQMAQAPVIAGLYNQGYGQALNQYNTQNQLASQLGQIGLGSLVSGGQIGLQGQTAGGQLGLQGEGLGLQGSTAGLQGALASLGQNQNAALQAGNAYTGLGSTQLNSNLAGGSAAMSAAERYPQYLQQLMNANTSNVQAQQAYPFQTAGWYAQMLGALGPQMGQTSSGMSNLNAQQQAQQQTAFHNLMSQITQGQQTGVTTPPQNNQLIPALGLGLQAAGMFLKRGGLTPHHMAPGGEVASADSMIPGLGEGETIRLPDGSHTKIPSYIPQLHMQPGKAPPLPPSPALQAALMGMPSMPNFPAPSMPSMSMPSLSGGSGSGSGSGSGTSDISQLSALLKDPAALKGLQSLQGGFNNIGTSVDPSFEPSGFAEPTGNPEQAARGGIVNHYQDGGDTENDMPAIETDGNTAGMGFIGPRTPLADVRSGFSDELENPRVRDKLMGLTHAEVGSQGPEAQHAFMESVFNRAGMRGQTLDRAMQRDYYPGLGNIRNVGPDERGRYQDLLPQVMSGSNVSNYATGNASGNVGFAGGPQTASFGGERYGTEGPDVDKMTALAGGDISALPAHASNVQHATGQSGYPLPSGQTMTSLPGARPMNWAEKLASSPLSLIGQGLMGAKGTNTIEALASGLQGGLQNIRANRAANEKLDTNYKIDHSGATTRVIGNGWALDTGWPTQTAAQKATNDRLREHNAILDANRKANAEYEPNPDVPGAVRPVKGGKHDPETIAAEAEAKRDRSSDWGEDEIKATVEQYRAGDKSALQNLGSRAAGARNLAAVKKELARQLKEEGLSGKDQAAAIANFTAQTASLRTAMTRQAGIQIAVEEARSTFPLGLAASEKVARTKFVPFNQAVQAVQRGISNPDLAEFVTANQAIITAYSNAMSRTGVSNVHSQQRAERLLNEATSHEAYVRVIGQMEKEMQAAVTAPDAVRDLIMGRVTGKPTITPPPTTTPVPKTEKDRALKWLQDNPNDPRAKAVRERLGAQ